MPRPSFAAALTALALVGLIAAPVIGADTSRVRVIHASPDAPAVDVYLDGSKVDALTNVPFGAISEYLTVPAGDHAVTVYATGTTETAVIDADVSVAAGASYTIAAIDPVASIKATVFQDDPQPVSGSAKVRVVHLSPDAPAVDIAPDGADPQVSDLAYPDATGYLALDAGTYDLEVRGAGSTDVALQLDPLTLDDGRAYSVFAIGSAGQEPLGGNALQVVVAGDGMAAPDTSTIEPSAGPAPASGAMLLALAALAAFTVLLGVRRRVLSSSR